MQKLQQHKQQNKSVKGRTECINLENPFSQNHEIYIYDQSPQDSLQNHPMMPNRNRGASHQQNGLLQKTCWKYVKFSVLILLPFITFVFLKGLLYDAKNIEPSGIQALVTQSKPRIIRPVQINSVIVPPPQPKTQEPVSQQQFIIPPFAWMFKKFGPNYLDELMTENNRRFTALSNLKINTLIKTNYENFLSKKGYDKVQSTMGALKERVNKGDAILNDSLESIQKRLVLFSILYENGGVIIDGSLTLTENFDWIRQIQRNIYANRGNHDAEPQVVGFYSPHHSSDIKKQNKSLAKGMENVDRYMVLIPAMQGYFVAAKQRAEFIGRVLDEMIAVLLSPESVAKDIAQKKYNHYGFDGKDVYTKYLFVAAQRVLQTKQRELDGLSKTKKFRDFAIDNYGLFLINCFYGPQKLNVVFNASNNGASRKIQNMAKYNLSEYEASVGPMRYLQIPTNFQELKNFLKRSRYNNLTNQIMNGSYLQLMYFPQATQPFIFNNRQKWLADPNAPRWDSLAKIIWTFYDTGLASAPFQSALFVKNLRKWSASSGFEFKEVNNSNLADYIDAATIQKIEYTIKNAKNVYPTTKANLVRLALIYKYGGVYLDVSVIAVESFEWLVNIAAFPSHYIFNRYGELPSVLMFWNPNNGGFFQWEVDEVANTKHQWRYSFENSIIIASKGSEFIKEWFDLLSQNLMRTIPQILKVFEQCNISSFKWITEENHYLVAMDSAKCVIGRRQSWITNQNRTEWKNGMAYYGIWGFSSFFGPFKIRANMNLANIKRYKENPFFARYSQEYVEGLIGKMNFMVKFTKESRKNIPRFIKKNFDKLQKETHSQSLFRRYFYDPKEGRFEKINETQMVWIKSKE